MQRAWGAREDYASSLQDREGLEDSAAILCRNGYANSRCFFCGENGNALFVSESFHRIDGCGAPCRDKTCKHCRYRKDTDGDCQAHWIIRLHYVELICYVVRTNHRNRDAQNK